MPHLTTPCYCLKTRRASAAISRFYDERLAPSGVTVRQYSLLLGVSRADGCSVRVLADMTELERSTLTRNLKPLFRQGLIRDASDRGTRSSKLHLTEKGEACLAEARSLWGNAQSELREKLGAERLAEMDRVMAALADL